MENILWYDKPATNWNEALPIGNGRLGGMIYGRVLDEEIHLNEDSVWYGGPRDRNNPDALKKVAEIRQLLSEDKIEEAELLSKESLTGIPESQRHYEPLGNIKLLMDHENNNVEKYRRELNIETAMATVNYSINNVDYKREVFSSYPDQTMVIHLAASKERKISFQIYLDRGSGRLFDELETIDNDTQMMRGITGGEEGIYFRSGIKILVDSGSIESQGGRISVKNADEATIILSAATSFRYAHPEQKCLDRIQKASNHTYEELKFRHITDYQKLYKRVHFRLNDGEVIDEKIPMDERIRLIKEGEDDFGLVETYFNFGRYLLISSSRPGDLPANLQGIWNKEFLPAWDSKFTININTQMNYWPAEICNLPECHIPLFDHIKRMKHNGKETAKKMYGA